MATYPIVIEIQKAELKTIIAASRALQGPENQKENREKVKTRPQSKEIA